MKSPFEFICSGGKLKPKDHKQLEQWCWANEGKVIVGNLSIREGAVDKNELYAYLNGPLINCCVSAYRDVGYDGVDEGMMMYTLKKMFAKKEMVDVNGVIEYELWSCADMTKKRLWQFVNDITMHLEIDLNVKAPDTDRYKRLKKRK
jgi:hypothetical protein